jgi:hypothetical protein
LDLPPEMEHISIVPRGVPKMLLSMDVSVTQRRQVLVSMIESQTKQFAVIDSTDYS